MWSSKNNKSDTQRDEPMVDPAKKFEFKNTTQLDDRTNYSPRNSNDTKRPQMPLPSSNYGLPSHMDDSSKIVVQAARGGRRPVETIERDGLSMFSGILGTLVGPAYVGAFGAGTVYGLLQRPDAKLARTRRLLLNAYVNNVGKTATRFANNSAAAVLLYIMTGKLLNFVFEEEFEDFNIEMRY